MKVSEEKVKEILKDAIFNANKNPSTFQKKIKDAAMNMYNITGGEVVSILNGKNPVEIMDRDIMFKFINVLHELFKSNINLQYSFDYGLLDVNKYFYDDEIKLYSKKISKKIQNEDVVFNKFLVVEDDQIVLTLTNKELREKLISRNKINYNPETQRDMTIRETKTGEIKEITLVPDALKGIYELIDSGNYISDALTLNINIDYYNPPKIQNDKLIISKDTILDCIDGFHRLKVINQYSVINPEWEKNLIVNLMMFNTDKAVRYILQEDKKNPLTQEQTTRFDQLDPANFIIDKLNNSPTFYLKNQLNNIKFVLNKLINEIFSPKRLIGTEERLEAAQLTKTIENYFNELIEANLIKNFSQEEWFLYLFILKHCIDNNKDFISVINILPIEDLLDEISFLKKPTTNDYKLIKEALKNV